MREEIITKGTRTREPEERGEEISARREEKNQPKFQTGNFYDGEIEEIRRNEDGISQTSELSFRGGADVSERQRPYTTGPCGSNPWRQS